MIHTSENRIIRFSSLKNIIGLSRSTIDRLEKNNDFPRRIMLGKNSVGWCLKDIQDWLLKRSKIK